MMKLSTSLIRIRYAVGVMLALSAVFAVVLGTTTLLQHNQVVEAQVVTPRVVNFDSGAVTVAEDVNDGTATVAVTLAPAPTGTDPVTIPIVVTAGSAGSSDYSVSVQGVDVGTSGRGELTITIVDDDIDEDNEYLTVRFGSNLPAGVTRGNVPEARVTITDNDTKSVTVSEPTLTIAEGASVDYTVVLGSQPTGNVTIDIAANRGGTDVSTDPTSLTFTTEDWATAQTVTITVAEDDDAIVDASVDITHNASGADYAGFSVASVAVTTTDNDTVGATITPLSLEIVEGDSTGVSYSVKLNTEPSDDVTVNITGQTPEPVAPETPPDAPAVRTDTNDVVIDKTTLTFTPSNWDQAQTVTITALEDLESEETNTTDENETLTHDFVGADYGGVDVDVTVTVKDKDAAGVTVNPSVLTVAENGSVAYDIRLTKAPVGGDVTVTITGHNNADTDDGNDIRVDKTSLTFTSTNFANPQRVTVSAEDDDDAIGDDAVTLAHAVAGADYGTVTARDVTVTITENDSKGVTLSRTAVSVNEGGNAVEGYSVVLDSEPSENVTVRITGQNDTDLVVNPAVLVFTDADWDQPQMVRFTAGADPDTTDDKITLMNGVSGGDYGAPANVTADDVKVTIVDDDRGSQGVTISETSLDIEEGDSTGGTYTVVLDTEPSDDVTVTVNVPAGSALTANPTTRTFTEQDWETAQTIQVTADQDADAVDSTATLTHTVTGADYAHVTAASVTVNVDDDDMAGVTLDGVTAGQPNADPPVLPSLLINEIDDDAETDAVETATDTYMVVLTAAPTGDATITIVSNNADVWVDTDATETGVQDTLTFTTAAAGTAGSWEDSQTVTVYVADDGDGTDETAVLSHRISGYEGLADDFEEPQLQINVTDDDEPGIDVSPDALTVTEGDSRSYTIKLGTTPSSPVTIEIESADDNVVVNPDSITLSGDSATRGTSIMVSVNEDDDAAVPGGNAGVALTHTVETDAEEYGTETASAVTVTVVENDVVGATITPTSMTLLEGTFAIYTVVLNTEPTGTVTVDISGQNTAVLVNKDELTFTSSNWDEPQTVEVTAPQDADTTDPAVVSLAHDFQDADYGTVAGTVSVTVKDDDAAGVLVDPTALTIAEGGDGSISVRLTTAPTANVVVNIGSNDSDVTVEPASLTFTADIYASLQTVTVSASEDMDIVADEAMLAVTVSSSDANYNAIEVADVSVTVNDDDAAALVVAPLTVVVDEDNADGTDDGGESQTYNVSLATMPSGSVHVTIASDSDEVTVSPSTLTFAPGNYNDVQAVTVRAKADEDAVNDEATLTHTIRGYALADDYEPPIVVVTVTDVDTDAIVTTPSEISVIEGNTDGETYTVRLVSRPQNIDNLDTDAIEDVVIVRINVPAGLSVDTDSEMDDDQHKLIFTVDNWDTPQPVKVTAPADSVTDVAQRSLQLKHDIEATRIEFNGDQSAPKFVTVNVYESTGNVQGKPTIEYETLLEDAVLTANAEEISDPNGPDTLEFSYQWKRGDADIEDATQSTYTVVAADVGKQISVTVSYEDEGDTQESVTSDSVTIYDATTLAPQVTQSGGVLTVDISDIRAAYKLDANVVTYEWSKNGVVDPSVTGPRFTLAPADDGATITVKVSIPSGETYTSSGVAADVAPLYSPGQISEIRPAIRGVTLSIGDMVRLEVLVYGLQGVQDQDLADGVSLEWTVAQGAATVGTLGETGTRINYPAPDSPGTYTVTASLSDRDCRPDDEDDRASDCSAEFEVSVRRLAAAPVPVDAPANPPGEIPTILTDGDGNQYEVFTPEGGGTFTGEGYTLTAGAGAIPNGEYIGIRVSDEGSASNAGMTHQRYTLGGNMYSVSAVDASNADVTSYALNSAAAVCVPLPDELRSNISNLALVAINADGSLTILSASVRLGTNGTLVCGNLSSLPTSVAVGSSGAPAPLPTPVPPAATPEAPDTGGAAPASNAALWALLLGFAVVASGTFLVIGRRRESSGK